MALAIAVLIMLAAGCIDKSGGKTDPLASEKEYIVSRVNAAIALMGSKGVEAAFADFRQNGSEWFHDDFYLFIWRLDGIRVVYPPNASWEGVNATGTTDVTGKPIGRMYYEIAESREGEGWLDYLWPKPDDPMPRQKYTFIKKATVGNQSYIIGCGFYAEDYLNETGNETLAGKPTWPCKGCTDEHGCRPSTGTFWCPLLGECIDGRKGLKPCFRIITETLPPYNYVDASGKVEGQSTEIVREILKRLGYANASNAIEIMPWSEGYSLALSGPQIALYSTSKTSQREDLFKWAGPIAELHQVIYARNDSDISISRLSDAKESGLLIGVYENDSGHQYLLANEFTNIDVSTDDGEIARKLMAGNIDLWFAYADTVPQVLEREGFNAESVKPVYIARQGEFYIAFSKDVNDSVVTQWQDKLDGMKTDGTFDAIISKYKG